MRRATLLALLACCACGGGRIFTGPPVRAGEIIAEPEIARLDRGELTLHLGVTNPTDREISLEPHRCELVGPDGRRYPESQGERALRLAAHGYRMVPLVFRGLDRRVDHAPGFFVVLDGFRGNGERLVMPPLALGHPITDPSGRVHVRRPAEAVEPAAEVKEGGGSDAPGVAEPAAEVKEGGGSDAPRVAEPAEADEADELD